MNDGRITIYQYINISIYQYINISICLKRKEDNMAIVGGQDAGLIGRDASAVGKQLQLRGTRPKTSNPRSSVPAVVILICLLLLRFLLCFFSPLSSNICSMKVKDKHRDLPLHLDPFSTNSKPKSICQQSLSIPKSTSQTLTCLASFLSEMIGRIPMTRVPSHSSPKVAISLLTCE